MQISNPLQKLQKTNVKKVTNKKSDTKMDFLTFVAVLQNFWLTNLFGRTFAFFKQIRTWHQISGLMKAKSNFFDSK
jgi:hypothetical protein